MFFLSDQVNVLDLSLFFWNWVLQNYWNIGQNASFWRKYMSWRERYNSMDPLYVLFLFLVGYLFFRLNYYNLNFENFKKSACLTAGTSKGKSGIYKRFIKKTPLYIMSIFCKSHSSFPTGLWVIESSNWKNNSLFKGKRTFRNETHFIKYIFGGCLKKYFWNTLYFCGTIKETEEFLNNIFDSCIRILNT